MQKLKFQFVLVVLAAVAGCTAPLQKTAKKSVTREAPQAKDPVFTDQFKITLAWDASPERDIIGYRLYRGSSSRDYQTAIDAAEPRKEVAGLTVGVNYYFAVTAYSDVGESKFSDELAITPPRIDAQGPANGLWTFHFNRMLHGPLYEYYVESSTDLMAWKPHVPTLVSEDPTNPDGSKPATYGVPMTELPAERCFFRLAMRVRIGA